MSIDLAANTIKPSPQQANKEIIAEQLNLRKVREENGRGRQAWSAKEARGVSYASE
jgi:hypothetical protein